MEKEIRKRETGARGKQKRGRSRTETKRKIGARKEPEEREEQEVKKWKNGENLIFSFCPIAEQPAAGKRDDPNHFFPSSPESARSRAPLWKQFEGSLLCETVEQRIGNELGVANPMMMMMMTN